MRDVGCGKAGIELAIHGLEGDVRALFHVVSWDGQVDESELIHL